ncbi:MAG: YbdK family carboxylate-amine ligase [Marmoricola sp.]|nr:YbdK family carboxylate-amine ligase [Marmoricola sp.]
MPVRKVGVEEELMLVDPQTGQLTAVSQSAVLANEADEEVGEELFLQQIETSTPPCEDADDLLNGLRAGRLAVGEAAAAAGARAVAMATPVLGDDRADITPTPRYSRIQAEYGEMARQSLVAAMHTHVEVSSDEEAVRVVDGIRPWLPLLVALSANSPFWQGRDTGHASWRSQVWGRWPTAGAMQPFGDLATYRAVCEQMIDWGGGLDTGMLYFDVRLAASFPTVEIRVADVCTDLEDTVLVALLTRALVQTVAADSSPPTWRSDLTRVAGWRAARYGLTDSLVHPTGGNLVPPRTLFEAAVELVRPALEEAGDLEQVRDSFDRVLTRGNGATRQRKTFESRGSLEAVVDDLARRTEESWA